MAKQFTVIQIKCGLKVLKNWYGTSLLDVYIEFATGIFCFFILSNNASSVIHILSNK